MMNLSVGEWDLYYLLLTRIQVNDSVPMGPIFVIDPIGIEDDVRVTLSCI